MSKENTIKIFEQKPVLEYQSMPSASYISNQVSMNEMSDPERVVEVYDDIF